MDAAVEYLEEWASRHMLRRLKRYHRTVRKNRQVVQIRPEGDDGQHFLNSTKPPRCV